MKTLSLVPTWGNKSMQLSDLWGRAVGTARETFSATKEKAQERLVVLSGQSYDVSLKWALVSLLAVFLVGLWQGYGWGGKAMVRFQAAAAKLETMRQAEIAQLNAELDVLRAAFDEAEHSRQPLDRRFEEAVARAAKDKAVGKECRVPVDGINDLIAEANK